MMKMNRIVIIVLGLYLSVFSMNGQIGQWSFTPEDLPMYQYQGTIPFQAKDAEGNDSHLPEDPYFLLGNYRLSLFTHVSGIFQFMTAERVWARLNFNENQPNYGSNDAYLLLKKGKKVEKTHLVGTQSIASNPKLTKRNFGIGFARYEYQLENKISCTRTISVKPSKNVNEGTPSFLISVTLKNNSKDRLSIEYGESMPVNYVSMNMQLMEKCMRPLLYPVQFSVDEKNKNAIGRISVNCNQFLDLPPKEERYSYEVNPPTVFMHVESDNNEVLPVIGSEDNTLKSILKLSLQPNESKNFYIVIGLLDEVNFASIEEQISAFLCDADKSNHTEGAFIQHWKKKLPDFSKEEDEVLRREMLWNAHFVEASAKYNEYYKETFIPQGSVYSYHFGDNIANRDHLQAALPACYINPELAKSCIRYAMKHSEIDGEIKRGNSGFGYTPASIYKESDEQLYMFNTVAEYLLITGDYQFLNEKVELYPVENGKKELVINLLKKYFIYLRDEIRTGPTGLIRLLNSDWADSFLHQYSPNRYEWSAESHLNSSMALAVLPKLVKALNMSGRDDVRPFVKALETYRSGLYTTYMEDLGDRKFSARAYLNDKLRFGMDNVCIEPQSYLLQIPSLSVERKKEIYSYIKQRISDSEKIGIRNREKPLWDYKGGEDCGIWFSLEYPLLLGVATFDKEEARRLLKKFSFNNYAKNYPQYWIGHWTAPDEINSTIYREGLYSYWISISNYRHGLQGYCSHPHTWPLYCYYKLKESF